MNAEIIRVLEHEYPEQWEIDTRMEQLGEMLAILKSGTADQNIDAFVTAMRETVEGVASGRVTGVTDAARQEISVLWSRFRDREDELEYEAHRDQQSELDEEEIASLERTGTTQKFAKPLPKEPNPFADSMFLMHILPSDSLAELAARLEIGDLEGAANTIRTLPIAEVVKRAEFERLPELEKARILKEAPEPDGEDPFADRADDK